MSEFLDADYWRMHESAAHVKLRELLPPEPVIEFAPVDEFIFDFVLEEVNIAVFIIDNTHDHTDSYHIEAKMKTAAEHQKLNAVFIEEQQIFNDPSRVRTLLEQAVSRSRSSTE